MSGSIIARVTVKPALAEQLHRLIRAANNVHTVSRGDAILTVLSNIRDRKERGAALAYVFQNMGFAYCTGEDTPADAFRDPKVILGSPADTQTQVAALLRNTQARDGLRLLTARIAAEQPSPETLGEWTWDYLAELPTETQRVCLFSVLLTSAPFMGYTPHVPAMQDDLSDEDYAKILWEHHDAARTLAAILRSERYETKGGQADAALQVLNTIEDPTAKSVILGYAASAAREDDAGGLSGLLGFVIANSLTRMIQ